MMAHACGHSGRLHARLGAALVALTSLPGCTPPACTRSESIALQLEPQKQLNQDRDGYSRSLVLRFYQLESAEAFRQISFEEIWRGTNDGAPQKPVVALPDELTVVPGKREQRVIARQPEASFLAVVANFREHEPGSSWQGVVSLPVRKTICVRDEATVAARVDVELRDYGLQLRSRARRGFDEPSPAAQRTAQALRER
jgi:type VI secretion system VasD/TssJ family lipoprotein